VQVVQFGGVDADAERVFPVLRGLEVKGQLARPGGSGNGQFLAVLRDVKFGVAFSKVELA
jgi:hypothetical protein